MLKLSASRPAFRMLPGIMLISGSCIVLTSCQTGGSSKNTIPTDAATIAAGERSFTMNCSGCHNFRQDGIGPQLSGLTTKLGADWIKKFIRAPQDVINSGDAHALQLSQKFRAGMPAFAGLKDEEINSLVAYINSQRPVSGSDVETGSLTNPIEKSIDVSDLVMGLQLVTQIPASSDSSKKPLARITKLAPQPVTGDLFVVDLRGKLYRIRNGQPEVYLDMAKLRPKFINEPGLATGFGSFAFHPEFMKNGLLYTTHAEAPGSGKADFGYADSIKVTLQWVLTEWKANNPGAATFYGTSRELMRINMVTGIHGVQEIGFNPSSTKRSEDYGLLYIGVGDGGCVENGFQFLAHNKNGVWGTIMRIDPSGNNSANGKYGIPKHNPFAGEKGSSALGEIYAFGFRNPHRFSWTRSGKMIGCNIGQANIEAVDLITAGADYGWPFREGSFVLHPYGDLTKVYPLPPNDSVYHTTYPIAEYDHDEGKAVCGGYAYEGTVLPELKGKFLFGDIPSGRLFYFEMKDTNSHKPAPIREWRVEFSGKPVSLKELCGDDRVDLHFARDAAGELYILTKADGKIYRLVRANAK